MAKKKTAKKKAKRKTAKKIARSGVKERRATDDNGIVIDEGGAGRFEEI